MQTAHHIPNMAVLIDADNTSPHIAEALFDEIAKIGAAGVRRIYGDFTSTRSKQWNKILALYALVPQQQFAYTKGKNASDITLVIDAMDLLHKGGIDAVCLVSSDSDFTRLAQRIREEGIEVFGFGEKKTPESFRMACTRFIYTENLSVTPLADQGATTVGTQTPPAHTVQPPTADKKYPPSKANPLLQKALQQANTDDDGWAHLGEIGSLLNKTAPDFDSRTYGCKQLSELVRKSGAFEVQGSGANLSIRKKTAAKS